MGLSCELSPAALLALYELIEGDRAKADQVNMRLADISDLHMNDITATYRKAWGVYTNPNLGYAGLKEYDLRPEHAAVASWLIAPLRLSGDSNNFGHRVQARANELAAESGVEPGSHESFRISVIAWTVGKVVGKVDRSTPIIPALTLEDTNVQMAYEGLLEHCESLRITPWPEMAGSAVFWRVGGVAEALRPERSLGASFNRILNDCREVMPRNLSTQLSQAGQGDFVECRNAFTHVVPREGRGLVDVATAAQDVDQVLNLIRGASYFIANELSRQALEDHHFTHWSSRLERVIDEFGWMDSFA